MSLKVVVIGCTGLVGTSLSERLLDYREMCVADEKDVFKLERITLFCRNPTEKINNFGASDARVRVVKGNLCNEDDVQKVLNPEGCDRVIIYHIAALLSGQSEENFDLGMKVNVYGTLNVIEQVRKLGNKLGSPQVYVYTSSDYVTCFNKTNRLNPTDEESFRLSPVSYGCQKACMEIMVSDYSRKGFINGRVARISAVLGRPGWSNSISFPYTGIFTIPLTGKDYEVPLPMDVPYPCSMLSNDIDCFIYVATRVSAHDIGHNRVIQFPCKSVTLQQIWDATMEFAREYGIELGDVRRVDSALGDTTIKEINVCPHVACTKARKLGLPMRFDMKEIVRDYYEVNVRVECR